MEGTMEGLSEVSLLTDLRKEGKRARKLKRKVELLPKNKSAF